MTPPPSRRCNRTDHRRHRFSHDDLAVSAVISVILMVAVAVVLAATVFVLVSGFSDDSGSGVAPKIAMTSDPAGTGSTKWTVKMSDATSSDRPLTDYQFILTTSTTGTIVVTPTDSDFQAGDPYTAAAGTETSRNEGAAGSHVAGNNDWQLVFSDVSGDGAWGPLDKVVITYDSNDAGTDADAIPAGNYRLDIRHIPTDKVVGGVAQLF